jgi:GrpB-like predicted nucleotidyltransferase (UPF0157 family)
MIDLTETDAQADGRSHLQPNRRAVTEVGILAYQAAWDAGFRAEADVLKQALAVLSPRIEHIGTTAVPGSAARPIIDVLVGLAQPSAVEFLLEGLRAYGYRAGDQNEGSNLGGRLLVRWQRGLPTHHVHVVEYCGSLWRQMLLFRDVLRLDSRLAREYEWLRRRFAGLHPANRVAYARAKATFIQSVVSQAH